MTTYYASVGGMGTGSSPTDTKDLNTLIPSVNDGDTILCMDGNYTNVTVQGKDNLTIEAYSAPTDETVAGFPDGHPARKVRGVVFRTLILGAGGSGLVDTQHARGCTFRNIWFAYTGWTDPMVLLHPGIVWLGYASDCATFDSCEFSWGYGMDTEPFDPTKDYDDYHSPNYNYIAAGPGALVMVDSDTMLPPKVMACYFHDLTHGLDVNLNAGPFVLDQCWFTRIYQDHLTSGTDMTFKPNMGAQVTRNIFEHIMGSFADNDTPHPDIFQHFNSKPSNGSAVLARGFRAERNFLLVRANDHGRCQFLFWQGATGHDFNTYDCQYAGVLVRDNLSIQLDNQRGIVINFVRDGLLDRNMFVPNPTATSATPTAIALERDTFDPYDNGGYPRVTNNITETPGFDVSPAVAAANNLAVGANYGTVSYSTLMVGTWPPSSDATSDWFAGAQRQTAYAGYGPRYTTLADQVLQPLTFADIAVWTASSSELNLAPGEPAISRANPILGPYDTLQVSVITGQFQIEDALGNVIAPWQSGALTGVACDGTRYLRLRHLAAGKPATPMVQTVTLAHGSDPVVTATFTSFTADDINLPGVLMGATPVSLSYTGGLMTSGGTASQLTIACLYRPSQAVTGTQSYLFNAPTGYSPIKIRTLSSGKIQIALTPWLSSSWTSNQVVNPGDTYLLVLSVDTTHGATCQAWNLSNPDASITWTSIPTLASTAAMTLGASTTYVINPGAGGSAPTLYYFYLDTSFRVDATDPAVLTRFASGNLGPNGQGASPTLSTPLLFLAGNAAAYGVAGGYNLGSGPAKFQVTGGALADADHVYPPKLQIYATPTTSGPYAVGTPIPITITVDGYSAAFNLTGQSVSTGTWSASPLAIPAGFAGGTISFTPSASGSQVLNFTNDAGYRGPATITLTV